MTPRLRVLCLALAGLTLALGCSETNMREDAGGITFDPRFADAGTDAGPPPSSVGNACGDSSECIDEGGACIPPDQFPGGYCTVDCSAGEVCPDGSSCVTVGGGTSLCLSNCDPSMVGVDQCRTNYGCAGEGTEGVCVPGCEDASDCGGDGTVCVPNGFGGSCRTEGVELGAACEQSSDCGPNTSCIRESWGFPGGSCGLPFVDCDVNTDEGCPDDLACVIITTRRGQAPACVDGCATDADCPRAGYECTNPGPGRRPYCGPGFSGELGGVCSNMRGDCTGGVCLSEFQTGWPDSYCVDTGCDFAMNTGCPGDGVCIEGAGGIGICLDGCATDTDCRAGYDCRPSELDEPTSPLACRPGCDDASVCGNMGFTCNEGTGLCLPVLNVADIGEPCMDGEDCEGGTCLSEEDTGWPAGTCALPGCRLSGTGPETACPMDHVCVDDGRGDPEIGVCNDVCTMPSDCRPGYTCTGGACVPGCTAMDCGTGRTCNAMTGLCE